MATVRLPGFKGGAGQLGFPRGFYPLDPRWDSFRRDLAYAFAFNEGSGIPVPMGRGARTLGDPDPPGVDLPTWGFTPNSTNQAFHTKISQRAGNFGMYFQNGVEAGLDPVTGLNWSTGMQDTVAYFKERNPIIDTTRDWTMFMVLTTNSSVPVADNEKVIWEIVPDAGPPVQPFQLRWQASTKKLSFFRDPIESGSVILTSFMDKRHVLVLCSRAPGGVGGGDDTVCFVDGIFVMRRTVLVRQSTIWQFPGAVRVAGGAKQSASWGGHLELYGILGRSMSDSEVAVFSNDPFGLLRPDPLQETLSDDRPRFQMDAQLEVNPLLGGELGVGPLIDGRVEAEPLLGGEVDVAPLIDGDVEVEPLLGGQVEAKAPRG